MRTLAVVLLLLFMANPVRADDPMNIVGEQLGKPPTPSNFEGEYDPDTQSVVLTWDAASGLEAEDFYTIYQDGDVLWTGAATELTTRVDSFPASGTLFELSVTQDGEESLRSRPIFFGQIDPNPIGPRCPVYTLVLYDHLPFVGAALHEDCLIP